MDLRPVFYVIGILLTMLPCGMVFPMLADLHTGNPDWKVFLLCIVITMFFGGSLMLSNAHQNLKINVRQAFMLTILSWLAIAGFGALPLYMSALGLSFTDAFFESMSGITTTGSTILTSIETAPPGILLWRAILQWFGGLGFIVMAISILPILKIGGMRLFKMESSESEKALPRAAHLAQSIGLVYIFLTGFCALLYMGGGLNIFDAACHAMTTLSTGGFSTFDTSFAHFDSSYMNWVATTFMVLGGLPFVLFIKAGYGNFIPLFRDTQVRWFLGVIAISALLLVPYLVWVLKMNGFMALEHTVFNIVSILTTTGYVSHDYSLWGSFSVSIFFFLTFVGACAGSTAGGIKIFRAQMLFSIARVQTKKLFYPNGVFIPHYNGKPIPSDVPMSVMSFFFMFIFIYMLATVALCSIGLDVITALSGAATAIGNVGPGFGDIIGPTGTFAALPDTAKWILSFLMLLGRLEIFTILVIFSPHFWRS